MADAKHRSLTSLPDKGNLQSDAGLLQNLRLCVPVKKKSDRSLLDQGAFVRAQALRSSSHLSHLV